jgi:hypothetical protein
MSNIILILFIISMVAIIIATITAWFPLNKIPKFTGEFVKVLRIALIKPTFTAAAYHKSFYKFYFLYSSLPPHAQKNITSNLNLLSSEVANLTTGSSSAFKSKILSMATDCHIKSLHSLLIVLGQMNIILLLAVFRFPCFASIERYGSYNYIKEK